MNQLEIQRTNISSIALRSIITELCWLNSASETRISAQWINRSPRVSRNPISNSVEKVKQPLYLGPNTWSPLNNLRNARTSQRGWSNWFIGSTQRQILIWITAHTPYNRRALTLHLHSHPTNSTDKMPCMLMQMKPISIFDRCYLIGCVRNHVLHAMLTIVHSAQCMW